MIRLICSFVFLALLAQFVSAKTLVDPAPPKDMYIGTVYVKIKAHAQNGCCTNISEVQNYAADKLSLKSHDVSLEEPGEKFGEDDYFFYINVFGWRPYNDACIGYVEVQFNTFVRINGLAHLASAAGWQSVKVEATNFNTQVLDVVRDVIIELPFKR